MYTTIFHLPDPSNGAGLMDMHDELAGSRTWKCSDHICAFADGERHLGHVIKTDQWNAYDATHPDEASGGFKHLGAFVDLAAAMRAVELSVERKQELRVMHAGAGFAWNDTF
jgi:hypothetical protein